MKTKLLFFLFTFCLFSSIICVELISSCEALRGVDLNNALASYDFAKDIDCINEIFLTIGDKSTPFKGTIDGKGFTLKNVAINQNLSNVAIFASSESATFKNIVLFVN